MKADRAIVATLATLGALSCAASEGASGADEVARPSVAPAPARPSGCIAVPPGTRLQARVDRAPERSSLCLAPGVHRGPVHLTKPITIWGPRDAVIRTSGEGTTVLIEADGAALLGVTVDGSGGRFDTEDSAVKVKEADGARIEGVRVVNSVFGILAERTNRTLIRGNEVIGDPETTRGMRGDGIRLWETRGAVVDRNFVTYSRDVVVWYSPGNRLTNNFVEHGRYGTHFMYSGDNVAEDNVFRSNVVGVFVMYSRDVRMVRNLFLDAHGPSGMGVGLKESGNVEVRCNRFVHNARGVYIDTSPLVMGDMDVFQHNTFELGDLAVQFHGRSEGNAFRYNTFASNRTQVDVEGGGDALDAVFAENHYDDYAGYDLDGDGAGDVPYEVRSLANQLTSTRPNLRLFAGAPALAVVDAVGKIMPLFAPKTIIRDERPSFARIDHDTACREVRRAN